jgi:uncharacterized protein (TIGR02646 family)
VRHIPLRANAPEAAWLKNADALVAKLKNALDAAARNDIIDKNSALWRELKQWLLQLSHGKCWFSEAKDCFSHWDVEHYRPKKSAKDQDGKEHDGYWWLAFDWQNLRICGNAGNRKKGAYFPLREGCVRGQPFGDVRFEQPALLDPVDEDDPVLLFFNLEGRAIPAPHVTDAWEKARVTCSVDRYNLDFPPLMDGRKTVWAECWNRLQEYLSEVARYQREPTNVIAKDRLKQAAKRVRELIREDREFSAVARACVESAGDPRVAGLLR